jgi:hypothetical protein
MKGAMGCWVDGFGILDSRMYVCLDVGVGFGGVLLNFESCFLCGRSAVDQDQHSWIVVAMQGCTAYIVLSHGQTTRQ